MCEVPTVTGEYGSITIAENFNFPYAPAHAHQEILKTNERISQENFLLNADTQRAFNQCHEVLRDPGKELLVFMLTDKDRKQSNNVPYSYLVAYALKGKSMSNKHLEYLVNKLREELKNRNIPVLCEAYDGQWHKFITEDNQGNSLTRLHGRDNWNKVSSLSKDKCIEEISSLSIVKRSTHEQVKSKNLQKGAEMMVQNINIEKGLASELYVTSAKQKMQYVHSVHPVSRPDLYIKMPISNETELKKHSVVIEEHKYVRDQNGHKVKTTNKFLYTSIFDCNDENVKKQETRRNRFIGLQDNEKNLLDVINPHRNQNLDMDINDQEEDGVNDGENEQQRTLSLVEYLKSDSCVILTNI